MRESTFPIPPPSARSNAVRLAISVLLALFVMSVCVFVFSGWSTRDEVSYVEYIGHLEDGAVVGVERDNTSGDIDFVLVDQTARTLSTSGPPGIPDTELALLLNNVPSPSAQHPEYSGVVFVSPERGTLVPLFFFVQPLVSLVGAIIFAIALIVILVKTKSS